MSRKDLYIFDLDGTLALIDHRRHLVQCEKPDWPAFYAACVRDLPNVPVVETLLALHGRVNIEIWSGRSDEVRAETEDWLLKHLGVPAYSIRVRMRPAGDFTPDEQLKLRWLDDLTGTRQRIVAVFDDRDKVVKMWREQGIPCFQVARGDF